jgi:formylglycine-generating enzyme required for sulfatase activity
MGSPPTERYRRNDEMQHEVRLTQSYWIGIFEVSQRDFEMVMGSNPSYFSPTGGGRIRVRPKEASVHPVERVSWNDAVEFCKKLSARADEKQRKFSYRLPTEAEWEWACRAGTTTSIYYGEDASSRDANFNGAAPFNNGRMGAFLRASSPAGAYRANGFGLCDMHGNVAEWCSDWYDADYYASSPKVDPRGPESGKERVVRGGGWANTARECRSAARNHLPPDFDSYNVGFRVVLTQEQ